MILEVEGLAVERVERDAKDVPVRDFVAELEQEVTKVLILLETFLVM